MAVYLFVYFRPGSSHGWYNEQNQRFNKWFPAGYCQQYTPNAYGTNRWCVDYSTPREMYHPTQPYWPERYEANGPSNMVRSVQPNPYKWVNPDLKKEPHHANTQREDNLSFYDRSDRSRKWSERSRSVCSTSSQASISSIVPTSAYKFEPASLYEAEPKFLELCGTL